MRSCLRSSRWQQEFAAYDFPPEVVRKIMLGNAMRALKLEFEQAAGPA